MNISANQNSLAFGYPNSPVGTGDWRRRPAPTNIPMGPLFPGRPRGDLGVGPADWRRRRPAVDGSALGRAAGQQLAIMEAVRRGVESVVQQAGNRPCGCGKPSAQGHNGLSYRSAERSQGLGF